MISCVLKNKLLLCIVILIGTAFYYTHSQNSSFYTWYPSEEKLPYGQDSITVATYNIQYGKGQDGQVDIQRTIAKLQSLDADIISLQEVERYSARSNFDDQVKTIAKHLGMEVVFSPSLAYPGLYYGNAILSKYPIKDTKVLSFDNRMENRSAIFSTIQVSENESGLIHIVNTHLGLNKEERQDAIIEIYQKLETLQHLILLMGDLNSTPSQNEYEHWNELLTKSNKGLPLNTFYMNDWQIDYIFHSKHFTMKDIAVFESETSDHYPLVGIFQINE
ncbi:endonuclease/exonuclease/phosphatase family protein [Evansella sp. AB-rgal1]|uniref:endonuclease/exonuclease/phosphatase family protein n=1 Tax=Evansella sp. AB-rgal1 TaxID=3242696 RepID=UPI00359F0048